MSIKDVFVFGNPAPKPWCAQCERTVKASEFSTATYLCVQCEEQIAAQIRQWATQRARDVARGVIDRQRATTSLLPQLGRR